VAVDDQDQIERGLENPLIDPVIDLRHRVRSPQQPSRPVIAPAII
jgi:hypothetical protein